MSKEGPFFEAAYWFVWAASVFAFVMSCRSDSEKEQVKKIEAEIREEEARRGEDSTEGTVQGEIRA